MPSKCCHFHARRNLRSAGNAMGVWVPGLLHYLRRPQLEGRWTPIHEPVSTVSNAMRTFAPTNLSTGAEMRAPNLGAQRDAGRGRRHGAFRLTSGGQSIPFAATGRDPHPHRVLSPLSPQRHGFALTLTYAPPTFVACFRGKATGTAAFHERRRCLPRWTSPVRVRSPALM